MQRLMVFTRAPTKKGKIKQTKKTKIKANDRIDPTESTPRPIVVTIRVRKIGHTCCTQKGNYTGWCGWRLSYIGCQTLHLLNLGSVPVC